MKPAETQRNMPWFSAIEDEPAMFSTTLVERIPDMLDAINLCIVCGKKNHKDVAEKLGLSKGTMSKQLNGLVRFDLRRLVVLMRFCGNLVPLQWLAWQMGYKLIRADELEQYKQWRAGAEQRKVA